MILFLWIQCSVTVIIRRKFLNMNGCLPDKEVLPKNLNIVQICRKFGVENFLAQPPHPTHFFFFLFFISVMHWHSKEWQRWFFSLAFSPFSPPPFQSCKIVKHPARMPGLVSKHGFLCDVRSVKFKILAIIISVLTKLIFKKSTFQFKPILGLISVSVFPFAYVQVLTPLQRAKNKDNFVLCVFVSAGSDNIWCYPCKCQ